MTIKKKAHQRIDDHSHCHTPQLRHGKQLDEGNLKNLHKKQQTAIYADKY